MRRFFLLTAASAVVSISMLLPQGAVAMTAGTMNGIRNALAETSAVESVVVVCRHRFMTSRRACFVDRSRPPTVCHHIRMSSRRDCY